MKTAGKILLMLMAVVIALAAGEGIVRGLGLGPDIHRIQRGTIRLTPDKDLKYELLPNVVSAEGEVLVNQFGMRNGPVELTKPPGVRRIACIGDSIAFGMGARHEFFSVQLERKLNAGGAAAGRWEVLNFGVPGYNIGQAAAMLSGRAASFRPDLVLYLYCLNDPEETSRELEEILRADEMTAARRDYIDRVWGASQSWLGRSQLGQLVRLKWAGLRGGRPEVRARYRDDMEQIRAGKGMEHYLGLYANPAAQRRWKGGISRIGSWSRVAGVPVWVVVFPVFQQLDRYPLADIHRTVAEAAGTEGMTVVDLLGIFQAAAAAQEGAFHADPLHPNERGYGLAAQAVADRMMEAGWGGGASEAQGVKAP